MANFRICFSLLAGLVVSAAFGATYDEAQKLFLAGKYSEAEKAAAEQVDRGIWNERWPRLLLNCQLTTGQYAAANETYESAIKRYPTSLTLRIQGLRVQQLNDASEQAAETKAQILRLLQSSPTRFASRDNVVAAGRYFVLRGEDARKVLTLFYDRVVEADPEHLEAHIATAELALQKGDFKVAAETLNAVAKFNQTDPRVPYLMARAWESSDSEKANAALQNAIELNPNHVPSLLFQADAAIDREQYEAARAKIQKVLAINPLEQEAFALLAVMAHLDGDYEKEARLRDTALSTWKDNPAVDHLIGKKLSQKYRFQEGADYQRKAIEIDSQHAAANFQLAQDLLRLGNDEVGWKLAEHVADQDQYNVVAHNLATLHDRVAEFVGLERDGIHVRMEKREAAIYGDQVLDLLLEAKQVLCEKYDSQPREPIVVEIFPEQKDFAIRTFGLPGGAGFLGVCFGRVITANSPASQGENPSNWRSVLWHEFCHVVTLEKTKNRMPRWLSEGISVYEERNRDASWGESMTPAYREMLLDENLTPVSDLSAAFLNPASPMHLQFAYYQSSLVIEFLVERHGIDALKKILEDLGDGLLISDALVRSVGSLEKLDAQFADYAKKHAESFGAEADWSKEELPEKPSAAELKAWVAEHPENYWGLLSLANAQISMRQYEQAKVSLEKLRDLKTMTGRQGGPMELLASVYRKLEDTAAERESLVYVVANSSDCLSALRRLIELNRQDENWESVAAYAQKITSINPMLAEGQLAVAESAEQLNKPQDVVAAMSAMAQMDPVDPAAIDYRMASALKQLSQLAMAKHHVLRALDEAPRYRDAHRLLLEITEADKDHSDETESDETESQKTNPEKTSSSRTK